MSSDRSTSSVLATLLSVPPILLVAAAVNRLLPPPPPLPAVVAANDWRADALRGHAKAAHHDIRDGADRPAAEPHGTRAP